jgi:SAM-dependent methyltransferase
LRVAGESLTEVIAYVCEALARGERAELDVVDPDRGAGLYAGEATGDGVHRPWRVWTELADRLSARVSAHTNGDRVIVTFTALDRDRVPERGEATEAYGKGSGFAAIKKLEDPSFVLDLREALARAKLPATASVLDVGVNTGDELALVYEAAPIARITGIDHAESAIAIARQRWPRAEFHVADAAAPLSLGRFDLVIAIGMMQSGSLDDRALLRRLVQDHAQGSIILGVPNCRYVDGEISYGARMRNFAQPELGLVVKDIAFYRKYLQQHGLHVFVTGRNYLFVTGVRAG